MSECTREIRYDFLLVLFVPPGCLCEGIRFLISGASRWWPSEVECVKVSGFLCKTSLIITPVADVLRGKPLFASYQYVSPTTGFFPLSGTWGWELISGLSTEGGSNSPKYCRRYPDYFGPTVRVESGLYDWTSGPIGAKHLRRISTWIPETAEEARWAPLVVTTDRRQRRNCSSITTWPVCRLKSANFRMGIFLLLVPQMRTVYAVVSHLWMSRRALSTVLTWNHHLRCGTPKSSTPPAYLNPGRKYQMKNLRFWLKWRHKTSELDSCSTLIFPGCLFNFGKVTE